MECKRWEEEGLLYSSEELNGTEKAEYEVHMASCGFCEQELASYRSLQKLTGSLEEDTDPEIDRIVMRLCTKAVRPSAFSALSGWAVKIGVPVMFIVAGFSGGMYLAALGGSGSTKTTVIQTAIVSKSPMVSQPPLAQKVDSSADTSLPRRQKLNNITGQDVVPVNLSGGNE